MRRYLGIEVEQVIAVTEEVRQVELNGQVQRVHITEPVEHARENQIIYTGGADTRLLLREEYIYFLKVRLNYKY